MLAGQMNDMWVGVHAEGEMNMKLNELEKMDIRVMATEEEDKQDRDGRRREEEERIANLLADRCEVFAVNKVVLLLMMMIVVVDDDDYCC